MIEANRSSSVSDFAWMSAAVFVAGVASANAASRDPEVEYRRSYERPSNVSPWAGVSSTTSDNSAPIGTPLSFDSWHFEVSDRIAALSDKKDGWKGPESLGASPLSLQHANHLLRKLAAEGIDRRPSVGLDYEGTFSFTWSEGRLNIDLTVYDDGTYSYFATDGSRSVMSDDSLVSERFAPQLLGLLLS